MPGCAGKVQALLPVVIPMKRNFILLVISAVVLAELLVLFPPDFSSTGAFLNKLNPWPRKSLAGYAELVLEKCSGSNFPPNCYDREIPKLMDWISMEDSFKVTRIIQEHDQRYLYCHVLGHNLSHRETQKDPDKWMEVISRCPATMCNNGCPHGAMMSRFNSESLSDAQIEELKPDLDIICEPRGKWNPTPIEISMCYHAIGHLFMFVTDADLAKSSELCKLVGTREDGRDYVQTCTEGVFMQVFQPLEPEDFALVAHLTPTKEKVVEFCAPFQDKPIAWEACRREAWPLYRTELMNPKAMEQFCSYSDRPYAYKTCQAAVVNMVTVNLVADLNDMPALDEFCSGLSTDTRRSECFAYASSRLMQIDPVYTQKGLDVCGMADKYGLGEECYQAMAGYGKMTYHKGTKEYDNYCDKMPGPWKEFCLRQ